MTSLYRRASPGQFRIMKIIEGAVRDACQSHPKSNISQKMARSIAKRATGTLTADWPDALAARTSRRSVREYGRLSSRTPTVGSQPANCQPDSAKSTKRRQRGAPHLTRRSPLHLAWKYLALEVGVAKRAGDKERMDALVSAIRVVDAIIKLDKMEA